MNRNTLILLFCAAAVIQIAGPASLILRHEQVLSRGIVYRFRTAPVDPVDVFRGRYVALNFDESRVAVTNASMFKHGEKVYGLLTVDTNGFANVASLAKTKPGQGDYITATFAYGWSETNATIELPFNRYFLPEDEAPRAETIYREHSRSTHRSAWVDVRVYNGNGVIQDLIIDGKPIRSYMEDTKP